MSYCRFSSDNFRCDVYAYQSTHDDYVLHVASHRREADTPIPEMPPNWWELPAEEMQAAMGRQDDWLEHAPLVPINHPDAGESYRFASAEELYEKLLDLRSAGLRVPDFALEAVKEDM